MSDPLEDVEEASRTGEPMPVKIHLNGLEYSGVVRVRKVSDGEYVCEPLSALTRRLIPTPWLDPARLPA